MNANQLEKVSSNQSENEINESRMAKIIEKMNVL